MTHLLISTPTAGGVVKALYATTLVKTVLAARSAGWDVDFVSVDSSYIARARNYFAHVFLADPKFTHLIMVDSDMSFEGEIICRMIHSDKPVVAAVYPKREIDLGKFAQSARNPELSLPDLAASALKYNVRPQLEPGRRQVRVVAGMCRVERIALGCSAIQRSAFELLISSGIVRKRPDGFLQSSGYEGPFYNFFDEIVLEDGDILSEDYSFCRRWRSIDGNEIWGLVDQPIGHVGDINYCAPYISRLLQGKS